MPYVSDAQRKFFHANADKLTKQGVNIEEWDRASKGLKLPERVEKKKQVLKKLVKKHRNLG